MAIDPEYKGKWPVGVVKAFRECIWLLTAARDERDIYQIGGFQFEKLKGKRRTQRSLRLNRQWRLIVTLREEGDRKSVIVHGIEDYH